MTLRKIRVLIQGLPDDSFFITAVRGSKWTDRDQLTARLISGVEFIPYAVARAAGGKGSQPKPFQLPNPAASDVPEVTEEQIQRSNEMAAHVRSLLPT